MDQTNIAATEAALLSGRWGDSSVILANAVEWYERAGVDPHRLLDRTLHPVAHYAALLFHENDADDLLPPDAITATLTARPQMVSLSHWSFTSATEDSTLRAILCERLNSGDAIVEADGAQKSALIEALALLQKALPSLSQDVLSYVGRLVLTDDNDRIGETMRDLPTVVLLGPAAFLDVKALAEALFHEALHTKTMITERSAMLMVDNRYERNEVIQVPWRDADDDPIWPASRAFLAYYVYAHLSVLWAALWQSDRSQRDLDQFRRVCFRAAYLSKQLHLLPTSSGLGEARQAIIGWLDALRVPAFDLTPMAAELVRFDASNIDELVGTNL